MIDTIFAELNWPDNHPRTVISKRGRATFGSGRPGERRPWTFRELIEGLGCELKRYGARRMTVMTALPLSESRTPDHTMSNVIPEKGVGVLFETGGQRYVLPCDKWDSLEDNLRAIIKHLEAQRGIERWGVATVRQSLSVFVALPAPTIKAMDIADMVSRSSGRRRSRLPVFLKKMLLPDLR